MIDVAAAALKEKELLNKVVGGTKNSSDEKIIGLEATVRELDDRVNTILLKESKNETFTISEDSEPVQRIKTITKRVYEHILELTDPKNRQLDKSKIESTIALIELTERYRNMEVNAYFVSQINYPKKIKS